MTLYHRKYYLYFGVTPVLIFFLADRRGDRLVSDRALRSRGIRPWSGSARAWRCSAPCAAAIFRPPPFGALGLGGLCLGIASPILTLTAGADFCQVPIACALCPQPAARGRPLPGAALSPAFPGLDGGGQPVVRPRGGRPPGLPAGRGRAADSLCVFHPSGRRRVGPPASEFPSKGVAEAEGAPLPGGLRPCGALRAWPGRSTTGNVSARSRNSACATRWPAKAMSTFSR